MKGEARKLIRFLEGSDKHFHIPVFQRNYNWKNTHCNQLFDDLVKVVRDHRKGHFFGSIVSRANNGREFQIIDGQQRLTTVSLLFLAMYNLLQKDEIHSDNPKLATRIFEDYLVDKWQPENTKIKLKPIKDDKAAFERLFDKNADPIAGSNITLNYNFFIDRIRNTTITPDQLYDAICSLHVIDITLEGDDNPQLIFESLNSTGLDLSEGDKVRNYVLMGLSPAEQERFYTRYWNPIESMTGAEEKDVSLFIRDFLSVKLKSTPAMSKIYFAFKEYAEKHPSKDIEELLKELHRYAKYYERITKGSIYGIPLDKCVYRLNRLETTVTRPFFLEILRENDEGNISNSDILRIFQTVESYIFRRYICDLPTNALNKIFLTLHNDVTHLDRTLDDYAEKLIYILHTKKEKSRFPDDEDFKIKLSQKDIYGIPSKNKSYLFERLENGDSMESKDIYAMLDNGLLSVEHIMPQHMTPTWEKELGEDARGIHDAWLHRLANLTLTAYNPKYSNRTFAEKRDMKDGYKDSGFRMNQHISHKGKWGHDEMEERDEELMARALSLWPYGSTTYRPQEKILDGHPLDDDFVFTGKTIVKFSFQGTEQPSLSWRDMFQKVLLILHQHDKSVLNVLADNPDTSDLPSYVKRGADLSENWWLVDDGIFIYINTSTQSKINILKKLFQKYDIACDDLMIYLKDEGELQEDGESRFDIRINYWTAALPRIREATGIFNNVKPSKMNWLSGASGHGGITYNLIANMDAARVELYIGTSQGEVNKKIYDALYAHKTDIEQAYGDALSWARMDEKIASCVYVLLNKVSVSNENDWERMITFHAQSCARLRNATAAFLADAVSECKGKVTFIKTGESDNGN